MSADPTTTPAPAPTPTRPIPVSSPTAPEPPPRFRWVVPLFIGIAVGAIIGGGVTFTMMMLATKGRGELTARQFDPQRALAATPGAENLTINSDSTAELGAYSRRSANTNTIRRRITISGVISANTDVTLLATQLNNQINAELTRSGSFSSGGGNSSTSGGNEYYGSFESTYYTRDGRRGQVDLQVDAQKTVFRATISLFEAK